jgi:hypothetical protein
MSDFNSIPLLKIPGLRLDPQQHFFKKEVVLSIEDNEFREIHYNIEIV